MKTNTKHVSNNNVTITIPTGYKSLADYLEFLESDKKKMVGVKRFENKLAQCEIEIELVQHAMSNKRRVRLTRTRISEIFADNGFDCVVFQNEDTETCTAKVFSSNGDISCDIEFELDTRCVIALQVHAASHSCVDSTYYAVVNLDSARLPLTSSTLNNEFSVVSVFEARVEQARLSVASTEKFIQQVAKVLPLL